MPTRNELRDGLTSLARRAVDIATACGNEESTKLYLVLPMVELLGYDCANPNEVSPEHQAGFSQRDIRKVDIAILKNGQPAIAIECKRANSTLSGDRGQLRGYFNALLSVQVGVLTNGIRYEFYVDSEQPNIMDEQPFLSVDLLRIAQAGAPDEVVEGLLILTGEHFEASKIVDLAETQLTKKRLRKVFIEEARQPSEEFCRFVLEKAGMRRIRKSSIDRHYGPMVKAAFEESLILPVAESLRLELSLGANDAAKGNGNDVTRRIATTERELALYKYVRRRLAYLVDDQQAFEAIEEVKFKDYIGKLVVFYDKKIKGWLFDYYEGEDGRDKYVFPDPFGEIITSDIADIDTALKATFLARVRGAAAVSQALSYRLAASA